nr:unnamed protein product [Anser cygnoides domesticus]
FPAYSPGLLVHLEQGEEAWIPDIETSEDEEPVRPLLRLWARKRKRWKSCRDAASSSSSNSSYSGDGLTSETEDSSQEEEGEWVELRGEAMRNPKDGISLGYEHHKSHSGRRPASSSHNGRKHPHKSPSRIELGQHKHACRKCGKSYSRGSSLNRHQRVHVGEKPFTCCKCGRSFVCSSSLKDHLKNPCQEKPYKCPKCEKRFVSSRSLQKHCKLHHDSNVYQCSDCGKNLTSNSALLIHRRIHTGERPY